MSVDTQASPTTTEHVYDVNSRGEVNGYREPEQDEILTTDLELRNGRGRVGDPVMVEGRRGTIVQFLFRPARTGKRKNQPGGWDVIVGFSDTAEPKERKLDPQNVDLLLDEITRPAATAHGEQTTAYGVPSDASFGDDISKPAPDLKQMALKLIQETEDFKDLKPLADRVVYFWRKKGGSSGGQERIYRVRFPNPEEKRENGWRIVVVFSADVCRTLQLKQETVEALVHESLCHVERDEHGNLRKLAPDWHGYDRNVERFGSLVPGAQKAAEALASEVEDVRNLRLDLDDEEVETGV